MTLFCIWLQYHGVIYVHFYHAEFGAVLWAGFFTGVITALGIFFFGFTIAA